MFQNILWSERCGPLSTETATFRPATFLKNRLQLRCFPVNIAKFLGTSILKNICKWLLLYPVYFAKIIALRY